MYNVHMQSSTLSCGGRRRVGREAKNKRLNSNLYKPSPKYGAPYANLNGITWQSLTPRDGVTSKKVNYLAQRGFRIYLLHMGNKRFLQLTYAKWVNPVSSNCSQRVKDMGLTTPATKCSVNMVNKCTIRYRFKRPQQCQPMGFLLANCPFSLPEQPRVREKGGRVARQYTQGPILYTSGCVFRSSIPLKSTTQQEYEPKEQWLRSSRFPSHNSGG
ncbi:hypothetical protein K504DRAFT_527536 [Pleomassaria siparia CBS 279.74]|uniref:Uncharacterized protein n=1 Tax=Pleomassaria siparia CBS 279.74 TaxID=1314801 RepID=A0A6G1K6H8_9PLEO|nr:hypothetical protein K504DRAFT_527536 [Pleomassaria siparia CBS 279.74]